MSSPNVFKYPPNYQFQKSHLTQIKNLSEFDVAAILDHARYIATLNDAQKAAHKPLLGKTQINLFFENSTRTLASFELAGKRIGADVLNMAAETSSIKKGETLIDTAVTLNAMNPDVLIIRHPHSGAADLLAQKVNCSVLNAGDGTHEHPTQALLDAYTIHEHFGRLHNIKIAICGDILHSRVARSNIILLNLMGAHVRVIAPKHCSRQICLSLGVRFLLTSKRASKMWMWSCVYVYKKSAWRAASCLILKNITISMASHMRP